MTVFLECEPGSVVSLPARGAFPSQVHVFEPESINAINAALAARRPLLVRGEPGTGKSQLAAAAACALGCVFVSKVIDAATEPRDLLWTFDGVARLAEAQIQGVLEGQNEEQLRRRLDPCHFLEPGPLWWAFDWESAAGQAELVGRPQPLQWQDADAAKGSVLLVDEIDKADAAVPNALLECLGNGQLQPTGLAEPVVMREGQPPLVVITTNEERALPDAFLRRCLVLQLHLPKVPGELAEMLQSRGRAHFPDCPERLLELSAEMLIEDRGSALDQGLSPPGQAEYLDLLRAILAQATDEEGCLQIIDQVRGFVLGKHPSEQGRGRKPAAAPIWCGCSPAPMSTGSGRSPPYSASNRGRCLPAATMLRL